MRSYHSRAYRKHFEGYTEIRNPESGKIERIYTAKYYRSALSNKGLRIRKCVYTGIFLLAAGLWAVVSLSGLPGTMTTFVSIFTALALFPLFFAAVGLFSYCTAPRNMTISEYNGSSVRLKWAALGAAIILAMAGIAELIFVFRNLQSFLPGEFMGITGYLIASALLFVLFALENASKYQLIANRNSTLADLDGATEITV